MADGVDDMTGADAAMAREGKYTRAARDRLHSEAPSAEAISRAVAETLARQAAQPVAERPLGEIVRASVRCGTESYTQQNGPEGSRVVTAYRKLRFSGDETADGVERVIEHGRPVALKRAAFERYAAQGLVIRAD